MVLGSKKIGSELTAAFLSCLARLVVNCLGLLLFNGFGVICFEMMKGKERFGIQLVGGK